MKFSELYNSIDVRHLSKQSQINGSPQPTNHSGLYLTQNIPLLKQLNKIPFEKRSFSRQFRYHNEDNFRNRSKDLPGSDFDQKKKISTKFVDIQTVQHHNSNYRQIVQDQQMIKHFPRQSRSNINTSNDRDMYGQQQNFSQNQNGEEEQQLILPQLKINPQIFKRESSLQNQKSEYDQGQKIGIDLIHRSTDKCDQQNIDSISTFQNDFFGQSQPKNEKDAEFERLFNEQSEQINQLQQLLLPYSNNDEKLNKSSKENVPKNHQLQLPFLQTFGNKQKQEKFPPEQYILKSIDAQIADKNRIQLNRYYLNEIKQNDKNLNERQIGNHNFLEIIGDENCLKRKNQKNIFNGYSPLKKPPKTALKYCSNKIRLCRNQSLSVSFSAVKEEREVLPLLEKFSKQYENCYGCESLNMSDSSVMVENCYYSERKNDNQQLNQTYQQKIISSLSFSRI